MRSRRLESLGGPAAVAPLAFSSSGRRRVTSVRTETRRAYRVVAPSVSRALGWPPPTRSPAASAPRRQGRPRRCARVRAPRSPIPAPPRPSLPRPIGASPRTAAGARRRPFRPTRLAAAANDTDDSLSHYYSEAAAGPPTLTSSWRCTALVAGMLARLTARTTPRASSSTPRRLAAASTSSARVPATRGC